MACRLLAGHHGLGALSEGTLFSSAGVTKELRPLGYWAVGYFKLSKVRGEPKSTGRAGRKCPESLASLQVFAVLLSFRRVNPFPRPRFPHLLNGSEHLGLVVLRVLCVQTLTVLPVSLLSALSPPDTLS